MQVDADSLGGYLRRERESRHMSLQDISAATKIQLRFLEALEQDRYDQLPPTPFVVGFLRSYAQCLSLAPDEIIAAYHTHHGPSDGSERQRLSDAHPAQRSKRFVLVGMGILVVVAALGATVHVLTRGDEASTGTSLSRIVVEELPREKGPTPGSVSPTPDTPRVQPAGSTPSASQVSGTAAPKVEPDPHSAASTTPRAPSPKPVGSSLPEPPAQKDRPPVDATKRLVLQATAVEDTWLSVEIDGDKRTSVLLRAGKNIQWEATERFVLLTIGNARGTRLSLNGQEIFLPPIRGNVLRDFPVARELLQ